MTHRRKHSVVTRLAALGAVAALVGTFSQVVMAAAPASAAAANYVFDPNPIAPTGTLTPGDPVTVVLTAQDSSGNPVGDATVYLSFSSNASNPNDPTAQGGSATVSGASSSLNSTPTAYKTGPDGKISINYKTGGNCVGSTCSKPTQGSDTITAQDAASSPTVAATDSYSYGAAQVDTFTLSPSPIAPAGSLTTPATMRSVTLQVYLPNGSRPTSAVTVYTYQQDTTNGGSFDTNSFSQSSPGAGCPPISTNPSSPTPCQTNASGQIVFTYTTGPGNKLQPYPTAGRDALTVQDSFSGPGAVATDEYDYGKTQYTFAPNPIAPTGSLGSSQSVTVVLTVTDSAGNPQKGTPTYLSLGGANGAAAIGSATATNPDNSNLQGKANGGKLSSSPAAFDSDAAGRILITYSTPSSPPSSGADIITAENSSSAATSSSSNTDSYTYAPPAFVFSPNPIAPQGSLSGNQSTPVTLTVQSGGQPQAGGTVFLSFSQATGGGSASVKTSSGSTKLTSTPQQFTADSAGTVTITYTTPATTPSAGTDTITAQDAATKPTKTASDTYSFTKQQSQIPQGYWLVGQDGGIFSFGVAKFHGSTGAIKLAAPIVGMASTPDGGGYWFVGADGGVFSFGDAHYWGSTGNIKLAQPVVGMATTPTGGGYWLVAKDGGIFSFGDARFFGSTGAIKLAAPIVGMAATPDGAGYWFVGSDGGVFSFGDAKFRGSTGAIKLAKPVVGMASTPTGGGYWLVASDGGIFTFGDARFFGSTGAITLAQPVVGMAPTPDGAGYWFVASDGGIFSFGDAQFFGSMGGKPLAAPIVGMAGI